MIFPPNDGGSEYVYGRYPIGSEYPEYLEQMITDSEKEGKIFVGGFNNLIKLLNKR